MRTLLALSMFCATASAAPVPKEIAKKSPFERIQGKWVIVTLDGGSGPQVQTGDFAGFTLTLDGDKLSTATTGGAGYKNVIVKFDFAALPMQVNVQDSGGRVTPGIFKFEDDKLYWCHGKSGEACPTEFKGGRGNHCFVWKRADK